MPCPLKLFISKILRKIRKPAVYTLYDTFGCPEKPPTQCPTFLERDVHKSFQAATRSYNVIVVYGESRQGKTWTIEKYCPEQLRIGCNSSMDKLSRIDGEEPIGISNLTQELGVIHEREENRDTNRNFIPLFYYDKANKKVLVLEPTIYEIKSFDKAKISEITKELKES